MKFAAYNFQLIFLVFIILINGKVMAQSLKKTSKDRVIYEQQMSYDDARKMQEIVQKMEKVKNTEGSSDQGNPLLNAMNASDGDNSKMTDMLKSLLNAMGIDAMPDDLNLDQSAAESDSADNFSINKFKKWEDRHNWNGISKE